MWRSASILKLQLLIRIQSFNFCTIIAKHRDHHKQLLAFFFGPSSFEDGTETCMKHKKYVILHNDIIKFRECLDEIEGLDGILQHGPWYLFYSDECRNEFINIDFAVLRAPQISNCIPPPGTVSVLKPIQSRALVDKVFGCKLLCTDTQVQCKRVFDFEKALTAHQNFSFTHKGSNMLCPRTFVVSNMCAWCSSVLGSNASAKCHVARSFKQMRCALSGGKFGRKRVPAVGIRCFICDDRFEDESDYHEHVRLVHGSPVARILPEFEHVSRPGTSLSCTWKSRFHIKAQKHRSAHRNGSRTNSYATTRCVGRTGAPSITKSGHCQSSHDEGLDGAHKQFHNCRNREGLQSVHRKDE